MTRPPEIEEWAWGQADTLLKGRSTRAVFAHLLMMIGSWESISIAPRDGTRLLLYVPQYGATTGHYDNGWHLHSVLNEDSVPTHFMKLPPKPTEAIRKGTDDE